MAATPREHRQTFIAIAAVLLLLAVGGVLALDRFGDVSVERASRGSPERRGTEFVARVDEIDVPSGRVTWRVACGTREDETIETSVEAALFEDETDRADPVRGRVFPLDFASWAEHYADSGTWVVTLDDGQVRHVISFSVPSDHDPCAA